MEQRYSRPLIYSWESIYEILYEIVTKAHKTLIMLAKTKENPKDVTTQTFGH